MCAALVALCVAGAGLFPAQPVAGQQAQPATLRDAAALEQLKRDGQYESLQAAMDQARFSVKRAAHTPLGRAAWHAPNQSAGYDAYVTESGVSIAINDGAFVSLSLHSLGYGQALQTVAPGQVSGDGQTINLTRDGGLHEWFINGADGLEHGFTLAKPPDARRPSAPLRLALQVSAGWRAVANDDGQRVTLRGANEQAVEYGKLVVRDQVGRAIKARLVVADEQVVIEVEDSAAVYPLTIDPLFTLQQRLTAADGTAEDLFGYAVALSGNTALVGAPYDDENGMEQGSAYVFVRNGATPNATWTQQARLVAQDRSSFDYFGYAVALDGETALVGAVYGPGSAGPEQGAVYVFVRGGNGTWTQQARLNAGDGQSQDQFGAAVALDGDTALVGAFNHQTGAASGKTGAAYIFVRGGATQPVWTQQARLNASDGAADDQFGFSVALDADTALIGAPADDVGANANQGSAYTFTRSGTSWTQQPRLNHSPPAANDQFGSAVALSGDKALIGAPRRDFVNATAPDCGAVYDFRRSATGWAQSTRFFAPNPRTGMRFGVSVAMSGDTAVIGAALGLTAQGVDQRSAYVFLQLGDWELVRQFGPELGAADDRFGYAVALDGATVLIGAYRADATAIDQGAAYAFVLHDSRHVQQPKLIAQDGAELDHFGNAVAISGDTLVVGAENDDIGMNVNQGSAYVFTRNGASWTFQQKLTAAGNDGLANDYFGASVAIDGQTVAVGASGVNAGRGAAYVFTRSGTVWAQQQKLAAGDGAVFDSFGFSVALGGNTLVAGAPLAVIGTKVNQGAAYVFTRNGAAWTEQRKLTASDGATDDRFGFAVALGNNTVAVGAPEDTIGTNDNQGSVYVFTRNGATWTEQPKLIAGDGAANDFFGGAVAISGDTLAVGAEGDTIGTNVRQGSAYVYGPSEATWQFRQKLIASDGAAENNFGRVVAVSADTLVVGASGATIGTNRQQGAAYVFTRLGSWYPQQKFTASDGAEQDRFGCAVAVSGDAVAVGALNAKIGGNDDQGAAYIFVSPACPTLTLDPASLPNGAVGAAYDQTITLSGASVPSDNQVTVSAGALPPGLRLDKESDAIGRLRGTPTAPGTYRFTITLTHILSGCSGSRQYTLTIAPPCSAITVNPVGLPGALQGENYSQTLTASSSGGGTAAYSFAVTAGALPPGLSLSAGGRLSGTPTQPGSFSFTVTATDANGCAGRRALTLAVGCQSLILTPATLPAARQGAPYNQTLTATGGVAPYRFTISNGALPPGLSLSTDGRLSGTPTQAGSFAFALTAQDAGVCVAIQSFTLTVNGSSETPRLVRLAPNHARAGTNGLTIIVTGESFTESQRMQWNGNNCETSFISHTELRAVLPAAWMTSEGTASVRVVDTISGAQSNPGKFRVVGAVAHASAASYDTITLAPDSIVAAFGADLATEARAAASLPLPTELAGTTVTVRDSEGIAVLAPLFFVAPMQVNYLMPAGLADGVATVTIINGRGEAVESLTEISRVAPGLFSANASGAGAPAAVVLRIRANGEQVYEPVARYDAPTQIFVLLPIDLSNSAEQVYLILFGTGIRQRAVLEEVVIELGETELPAVFAGAAPGLAGVDQVNVLLPASLRGRGEQTVLLRVNDEVSNGVNLHFQ